MRSGMPNWSAPLFPKPAGSPLMMTVVGIPVLILKMLPTCHPPSADFAKPLNDAGVGTAQSTLMLAFCPTLKSERPRSDFGANQYKELRLVPNVSPAIVEELSSIDFDHVYATWNCRPWPNLLSTLRFIAS